MSKNLLVIFERSPEGLNAYSIPDTPENRSMMAMINNKYMNSDELTEEEEESAHLFFQQMVYGLAVEPLPIRNPENYSAIYLTGFVL